MLHLAEPLRQGPRPYNHEQSPSECAHCCSLNPVLSRPNKASPGFLPVFYDMHGSAITASIIQTKSHAHCICTAVLARGSAQPDLPVGACRISRAIVVEGGEVEDLQRFQQGCESISPEERLESSKSAPLRKAESPITVSLPTDSRLSSSGTWRLVRDGLAMDSGFIIAIFRS
jgi:hypothetical protein